MSARAWVVKCGGREVARLAGGISMAAAKRVARGLASAVGRPMGLSPNPTLVHHGRASAAAWHVTTPAPESKALADLYGMAQPVAARVARLIAHAINGNVALLDNRGTPPTLAGHARHVVAANPKRHKGVAAHVAALRANADDYHYRRLTHEQFHARQVVLWAAIERDGRKVKAAVLAALRRAMPNPKGRNPRGHDPELDEAVRRIRAGLRRRGGVAWSVTRGTGSVYGWIYIKSPRGDMTPDEQRYLAKLLGLETVHHQGVMIPSGSSARDEYVARAEGKRKGNPRLFFGDSIHVTLTAAEAGTAKPVTVLLKHGSLELVDVSQSNASAAHLERIIAAARAAVRAHLAKNPSRSKGARARRKSRAWMPRRIRRAAAPVRWAGGSEKHPGAPKLQHLIRSHVRRASKRGIPHGRANPKGRKPAPLYDALGNGVTVGSVMIGIGLRDAGRAYTVKAIHGAYVQLESHLNGKKTWVSPMFYRVDTTANPRGYPPEMSRLALEATHYRNTGKGKQFLTAAIEAANAAMAANPRPKTVATAAAAVIDAAGWKAMAREVRTGKTTAVEALEFVHGIEGRPDVKAMLKRALDLARKGVSSRANPKGPKTGRPLSRRRKVTPGRRPRTAAPVGRGRSRNPRAPFVGGERVTVPYTGRASYFGRAVKRTREGATVEGVNADGTVHVTVKRGRSFESHTFPPEVVRRTPKRGAGRARAVSLKAGLEERARRKQLKETEETIRRKRADIKCAESRAKLLEFQTDPGATPSPEYRATRARLARLEREVEALDSIAIGLGGERERVDYSFNPRPCERAQAEKTFEMWQDRDVSPNVKRMPGPPRTLPRTLVKLGDVTRLDYKSDKYEGEVVEYTHDFKRPYPVLASTPDARHMVLLHGERQRITKDGLVN